MTAKEVCFTFLFGVAMLSACKREPSTGTTNFVKTATSLSADTLFTTTFSYDSLGRLSFESSSLGSFVYTYFPDSIIVTSFVSNDSSPAGISTYTLNNQGLELSLDPGDTSYYDSLGEKTEETYPGDTTFYTWMNGDKVSQSVHTLSGISTVNYSYLSTVDNRETGQPYLGKTSKHLVASAGNTTYSYTFDSRGRVDNLSWQSPGMSPFTVHYTYY